MLEDILGQIDLFGKETADLAFHPVDGLEYAFYCSVHLKELFLGGDSAFLFLVVVLTALAVVDDEGLKDAEIILDVHQQI